MSKNNSFSERCYKLLRQIPAGKVTTYGELARTLRSSGYRAVGQAMRRNPAAPTVPCHRVVRSNGELGGYAGGLARKIQLLKSEGVTVAKGRIKNFAQVFYRFR